VGKKTKKKRVLIIFAVLLAGIIAGSSAFGYFYFGSDDKTGERILQLPGDSRLDNRVSFLLIGADKRPGETSFNADSIIVASVDPDTKLVSMLSIPRDTRVTLSGSDSFVKINAVPMLRSISELQEVVTELTGIPLDGYVLTNFDGFKDIIDTLGGISLYVEKDMKFETGDKVDGYINLKEGEQILDGSKALQYARFRHDATADIGRTARQQKVLTSVAKETLKPETILKLPKLIPQIMDVVETDLEVSELLRMATAAKSFDSSNIITQTLPGYGLYLDNLSYWEVNRDVARDVARNLLLGISTDKVMDNTVMDLLDPDIKSHITVPGNSNDPNGTASTGVDDKNTIDPNEPGTDPITDPNTDQDTNPGKEPDPGTDPDPGPDLSGDTEPGTGDNSEGDTSSASNENGHNKVISTEIIIK